MQLVDIYQCMSGQSNPWEWWQLNNLQRQQRRTNDLLEQIRRQGLTPEQRAFEDAQRAAEAAHDEDTRNIFGVIILAALAVFAIGAFGAASGAHRTAPTYTAPATTPTPTPVATPTPELVAAVATPTPAPDEDWRIIHNPTLWKPAPRAQPVRKHPRN